MTRTRIKICGITTPEDAAAAVAAGADALGVVFAPSRRQVGVERAVEVLADVPPPVGRIGVFVDADPAFVEDAVVRCGLTAVQFHGAEPPSACGALRVPVVKAFRVRDDGPGSVWKGVEPYRSAAAALLFDTYSAAAEGGTGESFDWARVVPIPEWARVFLAGGLTPENVGEAVSAVRPFAVDVSSGVESAPGVKDAELMQLFVAAVRAADKEATQS